LAPPPPFGSIPPGGPPGPPPPLRVTARCGSFRLPLQRLTVESQRSSTVTRARPGSRGVGVPFRGTPVTRVALSWLRALPPRRSRRPRGLPRATHPPEPKPRKTLSWSSLPLQSRTASRLPALRFVAPTCVDAASLSSPGIASPGVLSPLEHIDVGCPLSHPPPAYARSREGEGYQALTGAVLRVLAPLDGSGCTRGTHDPLAGIAVRRGAPTLRGLVPCRSRPLESPYRAFPSRGAVPALAGQFSLVSSP
jgi:hypothetical protein